MRNLSRKLAELTDTGIQAIEQRVDVLFDLAKFDVGVRNIDALIQTSWPDGLELQVEGLHRNKGSPSKIVTETEGDEDDGQSVEKRQMQEFAGNIGHLPIGVATVESPAFIARMTAFPFFHAQFMQQVRVGN